MKIKVYSCRADEMEALERFGRKYGVELLLCEEEPRLDTIEKAEGCHCASIITTPITKELIDKFYEAGIRYISTRTIGFDHIDSPYAREKGIGVGNVTYSPHSVADYTVMLILMSIRKIKYIQERSHIQDFSLGGVQGRELHNLTVGVVGTGRIGRAVCRSLSGFGCKILAYDLHPAEDLAGIAEYTDLNTLLALSDLVTLHVPAVKENTHLINRDTLAGMKDGVILINTSRGTVVDTPALIDALESGKVGGAALDVIEGESELYYNDLRGRILKNRELAILKSYSNVIVTPHTAFYTDQAVSDMVENSVLSCLNYIKEKGL